MWVVNLYVGSRGGSMTAATSKMERFVITPSAPSWMLQPIRTSKIRKFTQLTFTCSKPAIGKLEKGLK